MTDAIWIRSEADDEGVFHLIVQYGEDYTETFDAQKAMEHAAAVLAVVAYAETEAAIFRQMSHSTDAEHATFMCAQMRLVRPMLAQEALRPMYLNAQMTPEGKPFLMGWFEWDENDKWQMDVDGAREHARVILEGLAMSDVDTAYMKYLQDEVHLEKHVAANVVQDLVNWRSHG